jgi:hypothetical protein
MQGKLQKVMSLGETLSAPDSTDESAMCPPSEDLCFPVRSKNDAVALICL